MCLNKTLKPLARLYSDSKNFLICYKIISGTVLPQELVVFVQKLSNPWLLLWCIIIHIKSNKALLKCLSDTSDT